MTNTPEIIEQLVQATHGCSDQRTQHLYRQSLQVLVELAKAEQRVEMAMDMPERVRGLASGMVH